MYKRSVDKQKLRKLERAAGGFFLFMLRTGHIPGIRPSGGTPKIWVARLLSRLELHMNDGLFSSKYRILADLAVSVNERGPPPPKKLT